MRRLKRREVARLHRAVLGLVLALVAGCATSPQYPSPKGLAPQQENTSLQSSEPVWARAKDQCRARVADAFEYCTREAFPRDVFRRDGATHFVVADFRPSCETEADIQVGRLAANEVERLLRDYLLQVALEDEAQAEARSVGAIEVYRLRCVMKDGTQAREVGEALGADLVLWGDAKCPLRAPQGGPLVNVINQVSIEAKDHAQVRTGDMQQRGEVSRETMAVVSGSFCAHAVLTAEGWPSLRSLSAEADVRAAMELYQGGLELPQVVAGDALGLTLFVGGLHFFRTEDYPRALRLFRRASEKLRTDSTSAADLLLAVGLTENSAGRLDIGADYFTRCESLAQRGDSTWAQCRFYGIYHKNLTDDDAAARKLAEDALAQSRADGKLIAEANFLVSLGDLELGDSKLKEARARYEEALPLFREVGSRLGEATTLRGLGDVALRESELKEARVHCTQAVVLYRASGHRLGQALSQNCLGDVSLAEGDWKDARSHYDEALLLSRFLGERFSAANTLRGLGDVALAEDDWKEARARYDEALSLYRVIGFQKGEANALISLGEVALREDQLKEARSRYDEALPLYRAIGSKLGEASALQALGDVASREGNSEEARVHYNEALLLYRTIRNSLGEASTLRRLRDGM